MNRLKVARSAVSMAVLLLSLVGASGAHAKATQDGKSQLAFGVDMAKRGLWSEALFRFEQARRLQPASVSILNNLAICYEAGGRFEEALATYREALPAGARKPGAETELLPLRRVLSRLPSPERHGSRHGAGARAAASGSSGDGGDARRGRAGGRACAGTGSRAAASAGRDPSSPGPARWVGA